MKNKLPLINSAHGSDTRNVINEAIKTINDRGLEILSESGFLTWLEQNKIKIEGTVQSITDLPSNSPVNTVYGVLDNNKLYIRRNNEWVSYQTIDLNPLNEIDERLGSDLQQRGVNIAQPPFNLSPDGVSDDTTTFQQAINYLGSIGGGTLIIPKMTNDYTLVASNPTVSDPKRILINKNDIHIEGVGNPVIQMKGITKAYIDSINDISSSGRDVFTVFAFVGTKNNSVKNIEFKGDWDGEGLFRYASPRAKAIGFIGCEDGYVENVKGEGILGNVVNATNSQVAVDGHYKLSRRIRIMNSSAVRCLENGFNFMGGTEGCDFSHSYGTLCGSTGFESASDGLIAIGNTLEENKLAGMALSGKDEHIKSNIIKSNGNGINLTYVNDSTTGNKIISENFISHNEGRALYFYPGVKDVSISKNTFDNNNKLIDEEADKSIIYAVGTENRIIGRIKFNDNVFKDGSGNINNAINLSYVHNFEVKNNTNNMEGGVFVAGSNTIENGVVKDNESNVLSSISVNATNVQVTNKSRNGSSTTNGTGTMNALLIPHGLGANPKEYQVQAASVDAGEAQIKYVLTDSTQLIVYFVNPPKEGTNNIVLKWSASY